MTKEQSDFLQSVAENAGIEIDVRDTYSGRCMYGRTTFAVVVDNPLNLLGAISGYIRDVSETDNEAGTISCEGKEIPDFDELRQDSMGMGSVIY